MEYASLALDFCLPVEQGILGCRVGSKCVSMRDKRDVESWTGSCPRLSWGSCNLSWVGREIAGGKWQTEGFHMGKQQQQHQEHHFGHANLGCEQVMIANGLDEGPK